MWRTFLPQKSEHVRSHYSQSSRENATPFSSTSPLASYKEVPPPSPGYNTKRLLQRREHPLLTNNKFLSFTEANIDKDDLVVRISLNKDFRKNDYGETVFYKDDGEILAAVYPRMGRMIVWNASIPFIFKPPAMTYVQAQFDVIVRLTTSKEKADQKIIETKVFSDLHKIWLTMG